MSDVSEVIKHWKAELECSPALFDGIEANYRWKIVDAEDRDFTLCLRKPFAVELDSTRKPDLEVTLNKDNFLNLVNGKLNPQTAFLEGKIKLAGDIGIALRLSPVLEKLLITEKH